MPFDRSSTTTVGLVVAIALAFAIAGVTPGVVAAADAAVSLDAESYSATRGAVVPVVVSMQGTPRATVTLTESTGGYVATATVADVDDDGRVRLELNTFLAGQGDERRAYRAAGRDTVSVTRLTPARKSPLPAGTYQLAVVARGAQDDAPLTLSPFTLGAASVETAPRALQPSADTLHTADTVATGDWVVFRFDTPGLAGVVDTQRPVPVSNLVYADPSTPTARSTHTVRIPVERETSLRRLLVDYDGGSRDRPRQLTAGTTVALVGVDRDGDGTVDVDLADNLVSVSTHSHGRYRLQFDGEARLVTGDDLVVRYDLVNPAATGRDRVSVRINDAAATVGVVEYGLAGQGTLGNGVTLDLVRDVDGDETPVSLPNAAYAVDEETGTLTVVFPAPVVPAGETAVTYTATLSLTPDSPYAADVGDDEAVANYTVVPRTATVDGVVDGTLSVEQGPQQVTGTTSVAPGSRLVVYAARYDEPGSFIQARLVTVADDGSWETRLDFRDVEPGTRFEITVYDLERGGLTPSAALTADPVDAVVTRSSDDG
jgi:hypothetical protein